MHDTSTMDVLISIYIFVVGTAFGSFALVLADRMHAGKDWVKGRSVCNHCNHKLQAVDLIPLVSWTLQNGRCRHCHKKISWFYPLVELGLGAAFVVSHLLLPYQLTGLFTVMFGLWLFGLVLMAALVVSDLKWFLLPSKIVYPLALVGLAHRVVEFFANNKTLVDSLVATTAALAVGAGLFWVLNKVSNGKWIGDGDYRLGIAMGLFLGDPFLTWMALFFASVFGLVVAIPKLAKSKNKSKIKIPFGPFLIIGLFAVYLVGGDFLNWYTDTFIYF